MEKKDIQHIAELARISFAAEKKEHYEKEFSSVLAFVEKLNEADVGNTAPMTGGTVQKNSMRDDREVDTALEGKAEDLRNAIPKKKEGWAEVKAVFEPHT